MEVYVYGPEKYVEKIKRACGMATVLESIEDVAKIPQGAILYVYSPKEAIKIKQKAPWITVRIGYTEVTRVKLKQLDVYELLYEIIDWGTCAVYVPDPALRQALTSIFKAEKDLFSRYFYYVDWIRFTNACGPTYRCREAAMYYEKMMMYWEEFRPSYIAGLPKRFSDIGPHMKLELPIDKRIELMMMQPKTTSICTAVGTPYAGVEWGYYLDYPADTPPEELATMLKERKLKFQKMVPKLKFFEKLCPKNTRF